MNVNLPIQPPMSADESAARSGVYRLLGRLWLREIDQASLRELGTPPLRDLFIQAGGILPASDDRDTVEQLAIDYCQLFVGPTAHLPPFQSVWESGQFQSGLTTSVQTFVEITAYPAESLPSGSMLDHLGIQLDVMGHILALRSLDAVDEETDSEILELANAFLTRHLRWAGDLLKAAAGRATTEFYRSTIQLTRDFLNIETQAAEAFEVQGSGKPIRHRPPPH